MKEYIRGHYFAGCFHEGMAGEHRAGDGDGKRNLLDGVDGVVVQDQAPVLLDLVPVRRLGRRLLGRLAVDLGRPAAPAAGRHRDS